MRAPSGSFAIGLALVAATGLLPRCAPEELVYQPSGSPDGAAGTGSSSGTGGTGIGGSVGWAEICGNGIDDDNNGKTDCEDATCSSYACVDLAPTDWQGPVAMLSGPSGALPECPKGLTSVFTGGTEPTFAPATCGTCSCGSPGSSACSNVSVSYHGNTSCTSQVGSGTASSACSAAFLGTVAALQVSASASGSCGAGSTSPPSLAEPNFANQVRGCALTEGKPAGCSAGKVCAPLTSQALACVFQSGDVSCPSGYPDRRLVHDSFTDSRTCSGCDCGFASDGCTFDLKGYQISDCTTQLLSANTPGCYVGDVHAVTVTSIGLSNPRCDPASSPSPSGCASATNPTTVCCAAPDGGECPSGKGPSMVRVTAPGGGSYCIDTTEVTRKHYAQFLATSPSTAGQPAACAWNTTFSSFNMGSDDRPVANVDWCDAHAFCAWAGKRLCGKIGGGAVAQPTTAPESQWYNACSLGGARKYPYGSAQAPGACGAGGSNSPVGSSPCCQGGFSGLFDMVGSVGEWEDGCQTKDPSGKDDTCFVRGKAACDEPSTDQRDRKTNSIGFRCCAP